MRHLILVVLLACCASGPEPAPAQALDPAPEWNDARALELIRRAQARRMESATDTGLVNYRASARGYVYFYLDREDTGERNLVKTDQLALDVFWAAPDQVKQRIIGWRDQKSLPTNINYHIDHLSVVLENFGDEIRLGDGDEVRGVVHPAAPGAEAVYDYRLADSLVLRLPGAEGPVAVYQLEVRPRDPARPALVGSVFVDRRSGDLVRLDFTFTAAAYVDRYLDYINISLDNGLWRGRYWLPNEQRVEIRRRIPQLDIPAGSVIRANMRVGGYRFNEELPRGTFAGPPVSALPRAQREAFPFEEELHAEVREEGLGPQVELSEIRRRARELARGQALRRASGLRLRLPGASEVLRYNRSEGLALGLGLGARPRPGLELGALAGYAFGADHPLATLSAEAGAGATRVRLAGYLNRPRDVGVGPVASGTVNTLASLFAAEDYTDLLYADGVELELRRRLDDAWSLGAGARVERQSSASLTQDYSVFGGDFRPVLPIDEASPLVAGRLGLARSAPAAVGSGWELDARLEVGTVLDAATQICPGPVPCDSPAEGAWFLKPRLDAGWHREWEPRAARLELEARAGLAFGELPRQELYLIGGRGTLPGYRFRAFGGDRFATLSAVASAELWRPWLRGRLLGAAGWADAGEAAEGALAAWPAEPTGRPRLGVGAGLGLLYDILRLDLARGLGEDGRWELIVEARPSFWDFL